MKLPILRFVWPVKPTLEDQVRGVLQAIQAHDDRLNDPKGNGSGDGAQPPTGDDYNQIYCLLWPLFSRLNIKATSEYNS